MSLSWISNLITAFSHVHGRSHVFLSYLTETSGTSLNAIISKTIDNFATFMAISKSTQNFEHFEKKITFIAYIFPKLLIRKYVVTRMLESSNYRRRLGNQRVKRSKTLVKSARQHFYANIPLLSNKLSCASRPFA